MRIVVLSYTEAGKGVSNRLGTWLSKQGHIVIKYYYKKDNSTEDKEQDKGFMSTKLVMEEEWNRTSAFLFIGAMGIAVRSIAPYIHHKSVDPAVLVMDEKAAFVIPVLSGHLGGAVALAQEIAGLFQAQAVITTATDTEQCFAVDVFAANNHLGIENVSAIKAISSRLLKGEQIDVWTSLPIEGEIPAGLQLGQQKGVDAEAAIMIGRGMEEIAAAYPQENLCRLYPKNLILGLGCRKGKTVEELQDFLTEICEKYHLLPKKIAAVTSIDRKKQENGIWQLSRNLRIPFYTFSAEQLGQVMEPVQSSAFVERVTGVDNVCERSAYYLAGKWGKSYEPVIEKQAKNGMTMSIVKFHHVCYWTY